MPSFMSGLLSRLAAQGVLLIDDAERRDEAVAAVEVASVGAPVGVEWMSIHGSHGVSPRGATRPQASRPPPYRIRSWRRSVADAAPRRHVGRCAETEAMILMTWSGRIRSSRR